MKANGAPERLYLSKNIYSTYLYQVPDPDDDTAVEYTRTDAFIKKACFWLRTHSEADYFELIPDANYCGAGNLNKKRMIDEFRKYMEGE